MTTMPAMWSGVTPGRDVGTALTVTTALLCALLVGPALARAQVGASTSMTYPPQVTVGQKGITGKITVRNANAGLQSLLGNRVCNDFDLGGCDLPAERGLVFTPTCQLLSAPGTCGVAEINTFAPVRHGHGHGRHVLQHAFKIDSVDGQFGRHSVTPARDGRAHPAAHRRVVLRDQLHVRCLARSGRRGPGHAPRADPDADRAHAVPAAVRGRGAARVDLRRRHDHGAAVPADDHDHGGQRRRQSADGGERRHQRACQPPGSTGKATFNLYPPSNPACSGTPVFTDVQNVNFWSPIDGGGDVGAVHAAGARRVPLGGELQRRHQQPSRRRHVRRSEGDPDRQPHRASASAAAARRPRRLLHRQAHPVRARRPPARPRSSPGPSAPASP